MTLIEEAAREVLAWVQPCYRCEGSGQSLSHKRMGLAEACRECGGYGDVTFGDIMEALHHLRKALDEATQETA